MVDWMSNAKFAGVDGDGDSDGTGGDGDGAASTRTRARWLDVMAAWHWQGLEEPLQVDVRLLLPQPKHTPMVCLCEHKHNKILR